MNRQLKVMTKVVADLGTLRDYIRSRESEIEDIWEDATPSEQDQGTSLLDDIEQAWESAHAYHRQAFAAAATAADGK